MRQSSNEFKKYKAVGCYESTGDEVRANTTDSAVVAAADDEQKSLENFIETSFGAHTQQRLL